MIPLKVIVAILCAVFCITVVSVMIPEISVLLTNIVIYVQRLFEGVLGNVWSNQKGINSAVQLIIIAVFVGWYIDRIKKSKRR